MITLVVSGLAWGAEVELGGAVRTPCPAVRHQGWDDSTTPAFGAEVGLVPGTGPLTVRVHASAEAWHVRWGYDDVVTVQRVELRGEGRVALRLATGLGPGVSGTLDLGLGLAGTTGQPSRLLWSPTLALRPALHLSKQASGAWLAVDGRVGTRRNWMPVDCEDHIAPCGDPMFVPGGTSVALVLGGSLRLP